MSCSVYIFIASKNLIVKVTIVYFSVSDITFTLYSSFPEYTVKNWADDMTAYHTNHYNKYADICLHLVLCAHYTSLDSEITKNNFVAKIS